tara:strand:+ start:388 stop:621 length:234 start_codon:yes stop_codon:yes gene_type:complete
MTTVTLKMFDELNEVEVIRKIDGSNLLVNDNNAALDMECHKIGTNKQIEKNLNTWISERGNQQHDTLLTLISWKINK